MKRQLNIQLTTPPQIRKSPASVDTPVLSITLCDFAWFTCITFPHLALIYSRIIGSAIPPNESRMPRQHSADTLLFILLCSCTVQLGTSSFGLYLQRGAMQKALSVQGVFNYIFVPLRDALTRVSAAQEAGLPTKASTILGIKIDDCIVINMADADKIDARGNGPGDGRGADEGRSVVKRSVHGRLLGQEAYLSSR